MTDKYRIKLYMKKYFLIIMGLLSFLKSSGQNFDFNSDEIQKQICSILGQHSDTVLHSPVPFDMGFDIGGGSDVYMYTNHIDGIVYLTSDLIGKKQHKNKLGNYELMICLPQKNDWGANLISKLAYFTLESTLNSGETMDLGGNFILNDSKIKALLFSKYADFNVKGQRYGILLIIGITSDELEWAKENGGEKLIEKLKEKGIYPKTDFKRNSIFEK